MHTIEEISRGLEDLKKSTKTDIFPIISIELEEGGYFGVPRAILSYIDFLGALYGGYNGEVIGKDKRRNIGNSGKSKRFIREVMGQVYEPYTNYGEIMYEMYRHGTVHLFRPNTLINKDKILLEWFVFKGDRKGFTRYENRVIYVTHMSPMRLHGNRNILPISVNSLYEDLIKSIDLYFEKLKIDETLRKKYSEVVNALLLPEETSLF